MLCTGCGCFIVDVAMNASYCRSYDPEYYAAAMIYNDCNLVPVTGVAEKWQQQAPPEVSVL